jgi:hypothetical protein
MKRYNTFLKCKYEILIYGILIAFSFLAALLAVKNIKISPDAMRFGLVSQQIISGNGIRVPIIRLEDNYIPVNGAVPFLDQMPLVPIVYAVMGGLTSQTYLPAQILNVICHVIISVFTFLIMINLCGRKGVALLTGMLVSFSYPLLWAANHISSEPLFIALTVASVYFLILSRNSQNDQFSRNLFAAGICAASAILTRNAGITLIPVFVWQAFVLLRNKRQESQYVLTLVASSIPAVTAVGMVVRNFVISGSLRGFDQALPERSYMEAFTGTIEMIFRQFHLGNNAILLIAVFVVFSLVSVAASRELRREFFRLSSAGFDSVILFVASYMTLIVLTMAKQQWRFELRYVMPLVPFIFISGILITVLVWDRTKINRLPRLSFAGMILFLGIIAFGSCYKTYVNMAEFFYKQEKQYFILQSCTYKWIKENYGENVLITTNRPYHLSFFGGYSTIALPHKRFNPTIHVPDDMESVLPYRMSGFGSRVLALFEEAEDQYEGKYIAKLFNERKSRDKFELIHECLDGIVYNLKSKI